MDTNASGTLNMLETAKRNGVRRFIHTSNLDPASREEILRALETSTGAVVLVSHDIGFVTAMNPERVLVLKVTGMKVILIDFA